MVDKMSSHITVAKNYDLDNVDDISSFRFEDTINLLWRRTRRTFHNPLDTNWGICIKVLLYNPWYEIHIYHVIHFLAVDTKHYKENECV